MCTKREAQLHVLVLEEIERESRGLPGLTAARKSEQMPLPSTEDLKCLEVNLFGAQRTARAQQRRRVDRSDEEDMSR